LNVDKGDAVTRTEYKPYGDTWIQEGDKTNRPKFNSQELDPETGYYFYNARYYEAEIGRFVTADNIIPEEYSTQSWNRYSYVRNNPIKYKDPTGHVEASEYYNQVLLQSTESQKQRNLEEYNKIPYVEDCKSLPANAKGLYNIKGGKVIAMEFFSQRDNETNDGRRDWSNTCSVTGQAIIFNYMGIKQKNPEKKYPDELYDYLKSKGKGYGALTDNIVNNTSILLSKYDSNKEVKYIQGSNTDKWTKMIKNEIDNGRPVLVGGFTTNSGHIMVINGYNEKGFILHDPYGNRNEGYNHNRDSDKGNRKGKYVNYSYEDCKNWQIGSGSRGWTVSIGDK